MPRVAGNHNHSQLQAHAPFCSHHALRTSTAQGTLHSKNAWCSKEGWVTVNVNHVRHIKTCNAQREGDGFLSAQIP